MPGWNTANVRVMCTHCPWVGMRDPATLGEKKCPRCSNDVMKAPKKERRKPT